MNILVLSVLCYFHTDDYLFKGRYHNTRYLSFRENVGKIGWYMIRILQELKLYKTLSIFYGYIFSKKVNIQKFDYIFINEGWYSEYLIEYFLSRTKANVVFQYWNPIDKSGGVLPKLISKYVNNSRVRFQTFDYQDAKKYHIHYNRQFAPFIPSPQKNFSRKEKKAIFIGADKNRLFMVLHIAELLEKCGVHSDLYVFPDNGREYDESVKKYLYHGRNFEYVEVVNMVKDADLIIDIVQEGQTGMTWRPLEAMFYQKKLITTFDKIVHYDFYTPENIFIIGRDDPASLESFLKKPLKEVSKEIKEEYTFDGCMKKILAYTDVRK